MFWNLGQGYAYLCRQSRSRSKVLRKGFRPSVCRAIIPVSKAIGGSHSFLRVGSMCWIWLPVSRIALKSTTVRLETRLANPVMKGFVRGFQGQTAERISETPPILLIVALLITLPSVDGKAVSVSEQNRNSDSGTVSGWSCRSTTGPSTAKQLTGREFLYHLHCEPSARLAGPTLTYRANLFKMARSTNYSRLLYLSHCEEPQGGLASTRGPQSHLVWHRIHFSHILS